MSSTSTTQTISMDTILEQAMRGLIIQECEAPIEAPAPAACVSQSSTSSSSTSTQQQANTSVSFSLVNPFATIPLPPSQPSHPHWKRPPPQSCALSSVHADVQIDSYNATVNVTQTYNNHSDRWCEAVYVFPLDEQSAVSAFRAEFDDGTIIRGIVKEKAQAQREYRDAIRQNKQAALMQQQQHQENIFTCHIGNMRPFQSVRIVITYITQLGLEAGSKARFVMPQTIAPKYSMTLPYHAKNQVHTNTPHNNAATTTWSHQHIQQTNSTANDITIHINMPSAITDITSPSHDAIIIKHIDEGHDGKRATVQFNVNSDSSRGLDKDVVLLISQSQPYTAHALVEEDPITHSRVMQLTFIQPVMDMLAASQLHCEIIFVVDRSGSMSGTSMRAVIETLTIAMRSLPTNARFNIISFGDRYSKLWSSSQIYTETTMQQASKHIQSMQANMGGTELYACLNDILSAPITSGYPRQIFLLTDGQVSDTPALIRLVNAKASQQRLFTFGIGDGVDRHLCTSLAAAGHGEAEFVSVSASNNTHYNSQAHSFNKTSSTSSTQGDIATKVINQLSRALQPCLSDVRVDWTSFVQAHGLDMSSLVQIPATPTAIFPASRYFIYATLPPAASTSASTLPSTYNITVSASSNADVSGPQLAMSMNIAATSTLSTGNTLHKLAARARIHELDQSMLQPENSRNVDGIKQQIIHLAVSHQLVSSYTSFIAVSDTPAKPMYECHVYDPFLMEQQQQQQQQLYGGGGVRGGVGYGMAAPMAAPMMSFQNHSFRCASASTGGGARGGGARGGSVLKMKRAPSPMSYVPAAARSRSRSRSRSRDRSSAPSASYAELSRSRSSAPSTSYADLHMDEEEEEEAEMGFCLFDDGNTLDAVTEKENASTFNMDKKKKKSKESKEIIAAIQRAGQLKSKEISTSGPVNMTSTGKPDTHSILLALISLQSAMGHFDLTSQLIAHIQSVIGSKLDVDECIKTLRSTYGLSDQVIATILSVHLLTTYCSAHVAEARMIIVKAQLYLQKQTSTTPAITQATNQVAQTLVF